MAWNPSYEVADVRSLKDQMITYFQTNQADALNWANGGPGLPNIAQFHKSVRLVTVFPALTFLQVGHKSSWEDLLTVDLSILFQFACIHGKQDTLTDRSVKYSMALESMLANMPKTTFNQGSILIYNAVEMEIQTNFDLQARYKNQYIQVFETLANWRLDATVVNQ